MARLTFNEQKAGLLTFVVGALFGSGITLSFFGIVWLPFSLVGLLVVVGVSFMASKGRRLDSIRWFLGASGETQVRQTLEALQPLGYRLIDDLDIGRGNVDHVIVGPTGVFAIETKNWGGLVVSDERGLFVNGRAVKHDVQAIRGAIAVRNRVGLRFVEALLVYPSAEVIGERIRYPTVTVVQLNRLNATITSNPRSLAPEEIDRIFGELIGNVSPSPRHAR
jgi:hypothetical protein